MYVFNTKNIGGREYTEKDLVQLIPGHRYGLDPNFYGGRVASIGKTDTDILLLLDKDIKVIDTGAESLENIPAKILKSMAEKRKIEFNTRTTREELIEKLK